MNIVADESIDRQVVDVLREHDHVVRYVAEMAPGIPDDTVLEIATAENALLLTADKDFGDLVFRQHRLETGVVLIRLAGLSSAAKARIVVSAVEDHEVELQDAFTVISPGTIRVRPRR